MSKKMIFFDIDGTLITEGSHILPESTVMAIRMAREQGHATFINTGRTHFNIEDTIRNIGFDGYVCGCGTRIYYQDQSISTHVIPSNICKEVIEVLRDCNVDALFEADTHVFFDAARQPATKELSDLRARFGTKSIDITDRFDELPLEFDKFVTWTNTRSDTRTFHQYISKHFDFIDRGNHFGEIVPKGYSKATGIQFLCDYLHVPLDHCYAIGDSTNDLPMLQYVPNSIAMGNSMKEILPYCAYQTTDILNNGIYQALHHYGLLG